DHVPSVNPVVRYRVKRGRRADWDDAHRCSCGGQRGSAWKRCASTNAVGCSPHPPDCPAGIASTRTTRCGWCGSSNTPRISGSPSTTSRGLLALAGDAPDSCDTVRDLTEAKIAGKITHLVAL